MVNGYRKSYFFLIFILMISLSGFIFAQSGTLKGTIKDADGSLPGVNVYLKGTYIGASSDAMGQYLIENIPAGSYTLNVAYIGYRSIEKSIEIKAGETLTENFTLESDVLGLSEVFVTGVVNPVSKLQSSVSISTLGMEDTRKSAPRTTAEVFRTIPGIRSEASGGDGNTNITVRGVPISAGGSKYLQLQEDGLPVFQFGDIAFATADIFLRADNTLARIEAIRGGSASTMASNSPAGIINFISKTGAVSGGSISTTTGLDYRSFRTDFEYGSPLGEDISFHIGGFLREGDGPRTAGYSANSGGQVKMNITKLFDGGYGRIYFKYLNDRAAAYMPMPMQVEGTNDSPEWGSIDGFDALSGTMHSPYLLQEVGLGPDGALRRVDITDGMHPVSSAIGLEFVRDLGNGWSFENRGRLSFNSGRFLSPFPAEVGTAQSLAQSIGGAGAYLMYADGTPFGSGYENNGLAMRIHMFDTELNNFDVFVNDFKVTKEISKAKITVGYYLSKQSISMSWLWNSYLMEVNGEDAMMLDVYDANDQKLSQNGLYAYGVPAWGNLHRNYDTDYLTYAPYFNVGVEVNKQLNVDASLRMDFGHVTGHFAGNVQTQYDVNNDGIISPNEVSVSAVDNANPTPVDYEYDYLSFSVGANYKLNDAQAVFARYSRGGSAKADRLLFAGLPYTGGTEINAKDMINQAELGYKHMFKHGGIFVTGFMANTTEEGGFEATTQKIIENDYQAFGVEIEGAYNIGHLDLRGGLTYTKAEITSGANEGNTPRRQPALMFSLIPTYSFGKHSAGLSLIGQTQAYAQDNNELVMPAYVYLNAFINYQITESFYATINGNNLLDSLGITECEEGSIVNNQVNYVRARSIAGRSISFSLGYNF